MNSFFVMKRFDIYEENSLKCIKLDGEKSYISDDVDLLY